MLVLPERKQSYILQLLNVVKCGVNTSIILLAVLLRKFLLIYLIQRRLKKVSILQEVLLKALLNPFKEGVEVNIIVELLAQKLLEQNLILMDM